MKDSKREETLYEFLSGTMPNSTRSMVDLRYRTILHYCRKQLEQDIRADERQAVIKEIEGWLVARQLKNEREDEWTRGAYDELRELRAKLVEMKEGK